MKVYMQRKCNSFCQFRLKCKFEIVVWVLYGKYYNSIEPCNTFKKPSLLVVWETRKIVLVLYWIIFTKTYTPCFLIKRLWNLYMFLLNIYDIIAYIANKRLYTMALLSCSIYKTQFAIYEGCCKIAYFSKVY